jgi:hypothetical protein
MGLKYNVSGVTGNASGITSGNTVNGNWIFMGQNFRKVRDLLALAAFTAATASLTATGKWQGSNDETTIYDLTGSNNAARVVFATGTAAIVTAAFDAPLAAYGFKYARFVFVIGAETGGTSDLYSIAYSYRQLTGAESVGAAA